jgi:hypothetical protein
MPNEKISKFKIPNEDILNVCNTKMYNTERKNAEYGTISKFDITKICGNSGNSGPIFSSNSGPDLFLSGLFLRLKSGLPVGLAGAAGPVWPQAGLTQSGNPNFNTQKEVLVMRGGPDSRC